MRRLAVIFVSVGVVMMLIPVASAGNMAITSFDSLPDEFVSGETYTLHYTILQHGVTPVDVGRSVVSFTNTDTGEIVTFEAEAAGEPGRYTVDVTVPTAGDWTWMVSQGQFESHDFGVISIGTASAATAATSAMAVLRVLVPLAAIAAAWYTLREVARSRSVSSRTPVESTLS